MAESERYNPTVTDLTAWVRKRADFYRRMTDSESGFDRAFDADQMTRVAEALEDLSSAAGGKVAHGLWKPIGEWKPQEYEPVLLRLFYRYHETPPLIHYDVGAWRNDSRGGGWEKCRSGIITHCSRIITLNTETDL